MSSSVQVALFLHVLLVWVVGMASWIDLLTAPANPMCEFDSAHNFCRQQPAISSRIEDSDGLLLCTAFCTAGTSMGLFAPWCRG